MDQRHRLSLPNRRNLQWNEYPMYVPLTPHPGGREVSDCQNPLGGSAHLTDSTSTNTGENLLPLVCVRLSGDPDILHLQSGTGVHLLVGGGPH